MSRVLILSALIVVSVTVVWFIFLSDEQTMTHSAGVLIAEPPEEKHLTAAAPQDDTAKIRKASGIEGEIFPGNRERAARQINSSVFEKSFVFPDGEEILIAFNHTAVPRDRIDHIDDGVSGGFFEPLREAAKEGNASAAVRLMESLDACVDQPTTEEALSAAVDVTMNSGTGPPSSDPIEKHISRLNQAYTRCRGITPAMREEAVGYLAAVADTGHKGAALALAVRYRTSKPDIAAKHFKNLWEMGDTIGASGLSDIILAGKALTHEDLVNGYAYAYAAYAIEMAKYDGLTGPVIQSFQKGLTEKIANLDERMAPYVIREAIPIARNLIESNKQCCR